MEFIPGGPLTALLQKSLNDKLKCKIILDISRGMNFLHKNNIFHRDLKPDNVLVISESEDAAVNIKITDFDTARTYLQDSNNYKQNYQSFVKLAKSSHEEIKTMSNMGTLIYKPPEMMGMNTVDPNFIDRTDVFSFGVLTYHVFTQKEPFSEPPYNYWTAKEIETFIKKGDRLNIPSSVPSSVAELIIECWHQKARIRPDMEKVVSMVQQCLPKMGGRRHSAIDNNNAEGAFVPPSDIWTRIGWCGVIERDAALHILEGTSEGTFLIRWSARAESYVMSVKGKDQHVEHIADIKPDEGGITVVKQNGDKRSFSSLLEYVEAMRKQRLVLKPVVFPAPPREDEYEKTPNYMPAHS